MMTSADEIFPGTVTATAGVPLRVAAYMRISDAIRSGVLPRSSLLPSEADLGRALGVSRTVIREALILLEEDGQIGRATCRERAQEGVVAVSRVKKRQESDTTVNHNKE